MRIMSMLAALAIAASGGCRRGDEPAEPAEPSRSDASARSTSEPAEAGAAEAAPARAVTADRVERVSVSDARARVQAGDALLVCAYEGEERFRRVALEGAISYGAFEQQLAEMPRDREVIFYCS